MKKIYLSIVLLASLVWGACSSDDGSENAAYTVTALSEAPNWQMDWNNGQERPDWVAPDEAIYENWTILMVRIEEALRPFVSEDDMMALFVDGELRGLAKPAASLDGAQADDATFVMKAYGNEGGTEKVNVALKFYCHNLRHVFTLSEDIVMSSDESTGTDEDFIPEFTRGSAKYPAVKEVSVWGILAKAGVAPVAGNMVGAFVGDECRGTVTLAPSGHTALLIYGRHTGEWVTLKYYDAAKGVLYTIANAVNI